MFPLAVQRLKRMIGIADFWDLAIIRAWKRSKNKSIESTEKWDKVLNIQGKTLVDIHFREYGDKNAVLIFTDGTRFEINFTAELWEHNGKPRVSTRMKWR